MAQRLFPSKFINYLFGNHVNRNLIAENMQILFLKTYKLFFIRTSKILPKLNV